MQLFSRALILLLSVVAVSSCQKEFTTDQIIDPPPVINNDSIYTKKIIALDSTKAAPFDTVYVVTNTFDSRKRLESSTVFYYYNSGAIDTTFSYLIATSFYNGNDSLISRAKTRLRDYDTYDGNRYFNYAAGTGILLSDSSLDTDLATGLQYVSLTKYNWTGNMLQRIQTDYDLPNNYIVKDTSNFTITKQNGNIIRQQDNYLYSTPNDVTCSYDSRPNPSYKSFFYLGNFGFLDIDGSDPNFYQQRNNLTEVVNVSTANPFHFKYFYKYNSRNYPTECAIQDVNGGALFLNINRIKYLYTN